MVAANSVNSHEPHYNRFKASKVKLKIRNKKQKQNMKTKPRLLIQEQSKIHLVANR